MRSSSLRLSLNCQSSLLCVVLHNWALIERRRSCSDLARCCSGISPPSVNLGTGLHSLSVLRLGDGRVGFLAKGLVNHCDCTILCFLKPLGIIAFAVIAIAHGEPLTTVAEEVGSYQLRDIALLQCCSHHYPE